MRGSAACFVVLVSACDSSTGSPTLIHDFWVATSRDGAPVGRQGHAAVWTGTEMLVWGGFGEPLEGWADVGPPPMTDGARYRPDEDRWTPMSAAGAPSPRTAFAATWAGTKLFVWGGSPPDGGEGGPVVPPLGDGALYDPASDSWSPSAVDGAPDARSLAAAVWTGTAVLLWGGSIQDASYETIRLSTGAAYDVADDTWAPMSAEGAPLLDRPFVVWTGEDMLVFDYISEPPHRAGALYDPSTDSWRAISPEGMPEGHLCGPVWAGSSLVVYDADAAVVAMYDPSGDAWSAVPSTRSLCGVIGPEWTGELILYWGTGSSPPAPQVRLDLGSGTTTPMSRKHEPSARSSHSSVWTGHEMIVWGGDEAGGSYTDTGGRYTP